MKKIFIPAAAAMFFCALVGCNHVEKGGMSDTAKKNLETSNAIVKAIETKDIASLDKYMAADAIDHSGMTGEVKGLDNIKKDLEKMCSMSKDAKMEVIKEIADDEYVYQWIRSSGEAATADMGMPVGTKYNMSSVDITKYKDGKASEHWFFMEMGDVNNMMKAMSPPHTEGASKMDSSKMSK